MKESSDRSSKSMQLIMPPPLRFATQRNVQWAAFGHSRSITWI